MKKEYTYKFAFYCFLLAGLLILFAVVTSCTRKVATVTTATPAMVPAHPKEPEWFNKLSKTAPSEKENH